MSYPRVVENHGYFEGVGGLRLHYRTWEPHVPRAAVIAVHGLAEHVGRYQEFGRALAAEGVACFAHDMRGHGMSEGRRGHVRSFDVLLQDLERFRREVHGLIEPDCPLFLLGHSMGGLVALRYLEVYQPDMAGAIVVSPWLATAVQVPRWKVLLANTLNRMLPALPFRAGIRSEWLSRDPAVCTAYADDPLVHDTITPRLFTEVAHAMGMVLKGSDSIRLPMLFLLAGQDKIVDTPRTLALARSLSAGRVTVSLHEEAFHELLNEPERRQIRQEILDWIEAQQAGTTAEPESDSSSPVST